MINFQNCVFGDGYVSFRKADFGDNSVFFVGAKFGTGTFHFQEFIIGGGDIFFDYAQFGDGHFYFVTECTIQRNVSFEHANFGDGEAHFEACFEGEIVSFERAKFGKGRVLFCKSNFKAVEVNFNDTIFRAGHVNFNNTKMSSDVLFFCNVRLESGFMSFRNMEITNTQVIATNLWVNGNLEISSRFPNIVDFQRLKIGESTSFNGCTFDHIPDFRDASFELPPDVANMEVGTPKLSKTYFWQFSVAEDPEDVSRLRKLKAMALQASDHERDGYFFAKEMRAKRGVETEGFFSLLFNTLYDWFSGYGQSFVKPLAWLAASFILFFIIYTHIVEHSFNIANMRAFPGEHSLLNFLPLIGGLFRYAPAPEKYVSPYEKLYAQLPDTNISLLVNLGILQSIIGGILLFFFLLALRNRFRLK